MARVNKLNGELYEEQPRRHAVAWFVDNPVGRVVTTTIVAAAAAASIFTAVPKDRPEINIPSINRPFDSGSSQSSGQTVTDVYYSQVRASLLQDVPELVNYQSALDYTTQRMVDAKNIFGLSLEQTRAPIAKWVQFNVDIDKRGERLIKLEDNPNYIPLDLFGENETYDPTVRQKNLDTATPARINGTKIPYAAMLAANIDSIIAGHDQIWAELQDPTKMKKYLDSAIYSTPLPFTREEATKYKSVITQHGTQEDVKHLALMGASYYYGKTNEEITRNEVSAAMALAVGGDIRIERNEQLWDVSAYKGSTKIRPDQGDRQPAFRKSKTLKDYLSANQSTYGTPLDQDYLAPELPSLQAIEKAKGWVSPDTGVRLIEIQSVTLTSYTTGNGRIFPK